MYEGKTPKLLEAAELARAAIKGLANGTLTVDEAKALNRQADRLIKSVAGKRSAIINLNQVSH